MKIWVTFETNDNVGKKERIPQGFWTQSEECVKRQGKRWKFEERDIDALPPGVEFDRMPDRWGKA